MIQLLVSLTHGTCCTVPQEFRTLYSLLSVVTGNIDDAEDDLTKVDKIFMSMDEDGNGQVELEELKLWLVDKVVRLLRFCSFPFTYPQTCKNLMQA